MTSLLLLAGRIKHMGMKNKQRHCLGVREDILQKNDYFIRFPSKYFVAGALILNFLHC